MIRRLRFSVQMLPRVTENGTEVEGCIVLKSHSKAKDQNLRLSALICGWIYFLFSRLFACMRGWVCVL